jgi:hypothetical protein
MAYNTGNPIGSGDPRDLRDNSESLDEAINGTTSTWVDRLGNTRKTFKAAENAAQQVEDSAASNIAAIEQDAADVESARDTAIISINALDDEAQQALDDAEASWETRFVAGQDDREDRFEADQDSREAQFVQLMISGGYTGTGIDGAIEEYASGITVSAYKEIIRENGEFWRAAAETTLPYTTTGAGMPEGGAFVNVGDGVLRQDLVQPVATFNSVADMKASTVLGVGRKARTLGYDEPGDGGGNDYEIVAAGTGTDDGGSFIDLAGSGLQARGLFKGRVSAKSFGVTNSGDSTAQAQNALNFCESSGNLFIGDVSFYASGLSVGCDGDMMPGCYIINNQDDAELLRFKSTSTGLHWVTLSIDGDNRDCRGTIIEAPNTKIENYSATNITASATGSSSIAGLSIARAKGVVIGKIIATNMTNTGYINESFPQSVVVTNGAEAKIGTLIAEDCNSVLVLNTATSTCFCENLICINQTDNGIYQLAGNLNVNYFYCENVNSTEPAVFKTGNAIVNSMVLKGSHNALGVENAGDVYIGSIHVANTSSAPGSFALRTRAGNILTNSLVIGSLSGLSAGGIIILLDTGDIETFAIHKMDYTHVHLLGQGVQISQWINLVAAKGVTLGNINIKIEDPDNDIDNTIGFRATVRESLTNNSFLERFNLYSDDYVGTPPFRFNNVPQEKMSVSSGVFRTNIGPFIGGVVEHGKKVIIGAAAPTQGYWKKGEVLWVSEPATTGAVAFVCITAGNPGVWREVN